MSTGFIHKQSTLMWKFLGFFQTPQMRRLHAIILICVLIELILGNWVSSKAYGTGFPNAFPLWAHMVLGLAVLILGVCMLIECLMKKGLANYFPYLYGKFANLKDDIQKSLHFKLVGPRPGGLASTVQGLGFGALFLTCLSGATWLLLRIAEPNTWRSITDIHWYCALLLGLYAAGHGSMALLHFIAWQRKASPKT